MALPASGLITAAMINQELGRASNAALSLNDPAVRALAGKPSGAISFSDFHGKSSEIVVTVSSNLISAATNMVSLFGSADWASATNKRLVINSGVRVRRLYITTAFGGTLTIENHGIIEGEGGAANGGAGGYGFYTNQGSPSTLKLINNGTIRGGGGGGGKGGTGGGGSYSSSVRQPASGEYYNRSTSGAEYMVSYANYVPQLNFLWNGVTVASFNQSTIPPSTTAGGYTYYVGTQREMAAPYGPQHPARIVYYGIYRTSSSTVNTSGGAGGNGGQGIGSDQSQTNGSAGAPGGTNAGDGGTGGNGGTWGTAGGAGAAGQDGNRTNGTAGSAGGRGGYSIQGYNRVDYSGSGSLVGSTANT